MRSTAEVGVATLCVFGDFAVFEFRNKFGFVVIFFVSKKFESVALANFFTFKRFVFACYLHHSFFNSGEIFVGNYLAVRKFHIVVETVFEGRTNTEFCARVETFQSLCHNVCCRMAECVAAFLIVPFVKNESAVLCNRTSSVPRLTIESSR